MATFVEHQRRPTRILCLALIPGHHLTLRYSLSRAARSAVTDRLGGSG